ncbi:hypothetical protein G7Z17_g2286 [Cylindrodendrum hubeiense]|uniref:Rhodopsin domain-containing protein n=1 Tax=Cylindrodendrum hubeiense TaxID=595255 RepID=A0A9P5HD42_9HYPO|nr:hypothetical protein G7Z17_g2286 [Cylindrodendrum hubeiense]
MSDTFTTEAFTMLGIGIAIIALRWYVRISAVGIRGLQPDDYLMVPVLVAYTIETVLGYNVGALWHGLANNGMTDDQRASLDPDSDEYTWRINGAKTQLMGWAAYSFLLWCLKAAMCTFYLRLTDGLKNYRTRIYVGFVLIVVTWITVICCVMFACRPFPGNWQVNPDPGNVCQPAVSKVNLFTMVVLNGATDLYLLMIPMPMFWMARIPLRKKLGLVALFSGGLFVTMAGVLRCVLILTNPVRGAQESGNWACRESFVAVVTTNLPMIFPLLRRMLSPILGSFVSETPNYDISKRAGDPQPGSIRLADNLNPRGGIFRKKTPATSSTHAIAHITSDGSAENLNQTPGIRQDFEIRVEEELRSDEET